MFPFKFHDFVKIGRDLQLYKILDNLGALIFRFEEVVWLKSSFAIIRQDKVEYNGDVQVNQSDNCNIRIGNSSLAFEVT